MAETVWRKNQPDNSKNDTMESCVSRKWLRDAEDEGQKVEGLDDFPCDIQGHVICEREAPDEYEINQPY